MRNVVEGLTVDGQPATCVVRIFLLVLDEDLMVVEMTRLRIGSALTAQREKPCRLFHRCRGGDSTWGRAWRAGCGNL